MTSVEVRHNHRFHKVLGDGSAAIAALPHHAGKDQDDEKTLHYVRTRLGSPVEDFEKPSGASRKLRQIERKLVG
ncbi:hypothetical protein [Desulfosoma sp.]